MAVVVCAYLAATLLTREATLDGDDEMVGYFRRRALLAGVVSGMVALTGVWVLAVDAPSLFDGLTSPRGLVLMALSALGGSISLWLLWEGRYLAARPAAALAVVTVLWGWGAGQYPWILEGEARISDYAAEDPVLWAMVVAFLIAAATAVPALVWLFRLTQQRALGEGDDVRPDSTEALMRSSRNLDRPV
jgi:cytochrome bd ubiquinol oxidase subunit II